MKTDSVVDYSYFMLGAAIASPKGMFGTTEVPIVDTSAGTALGLPTLKSVDWTDNQWYNFICGLLSAEHVNSTPTPIANTDSDIDVINITEIVEVVKE